MCVLDADYVTHPILDKLFLNLVAKNFEFKILSQKLIFSACFRGISQLCSTFIILRSNSMLFLSVTEFFISFVEPSHQKLHEFSILRVQEFFNFTQGFLSVKRNGCA